MIWLLQQFLKIAFLTGKPYDLPGNTATLRLAVFLSFSTFVIATWQLFTPAIAIGHALLDLVLAATVMYVALMLVNKTERFVQAFSALSGANAVLNIANMPVIFSHLENVDAGQQQVHWIDFFFLVWSISVVAHIVRFSFETTIPISIVAAVGYILLAVSVFGMVFS